MTSTASAGPAPTPAYRPQVDRLRRRLNLMFEPFWVVPAVWSLAAVVIGLALPQIEEAGGNPLPLLFQGGVDSARSVLSTTAGAMISVTGLVFSITIVVLQLASSQFSPRVLDTFLQSRITQHTLGVFAASFLYSLAVLRSIVDTGAGQAPALAVTVAFVLVLGSVAMFLAFIHHITQSISVATVIRRVGDETRTLLERSHRRRERLPSTAPDMPRLDGQTVVVARTSGYLDSIDAARLCRVASKHDARIEMLLRVGTFAPEGSPVAIVHGPGDEDWDALVNAAIDLRNGRSMEQDLAFGLRRLVDIAERALSPGINDPTTAVEVVDELHDLLRRMVGEQSVVGVHVDEDDVPRAVTREWTLADYLDLAVDEIAHYGKDGIQIPARLDAMFTDLLAAARPEHAAVLHAKAAAIS